MSIVFLSVTRDSGIRKPTDKYWLKSMINYGKYAMVNITHISQIGNIMQMQRAHADNIPTT